VLTEMTTVHAALAGMTTMIVGEATGRLRVPLWMTTLLPEVATMTPTAPVTTLQSLMSTAAGPRMIALLHAAISRRHHVSLPIHRGTLDIREMGMSAVATDYGNSLCPTATITALFYVTSLSVPLK